MPRIMDIFLIHNDVLDNSFINANNLPSEEQIRKRFEGKNIQNSCNKEETRC